MFKCTASERQELLNILKEDSAFLRDHNIIDYSLLLAIEDQSENYSINNEIDHKNDESRNMLDNQHFGIIDYLQKFNLSKKSENLWKTTILG